jgi:ribosomal protein S18 acetylase RimI-like enzyme
MENLYKVQKKDILKAGAVLADAFQHDPVWKKVLEEANIDQKRGFFEAPVRYCLKYGKVYATSERLEGIAAWAPSDFADMTFWRAVRSGSFGSMMKMGIKMGTRLAQQMKPIFEPLEAYRNASMEGRVYVYLIIIGVASEFQGQGFGGKLLGALIEESEQAGVPIYLETATERNVRMYKRLGFRPLGQVTLPVINLPQWGMVRELEHNGDKLWAGSLG